MISDLADLGGGGGYINGMSGGGPDELWGVCCFQTTVPVVGWNDGLADTFTDLWLAFAFRFAIELTCLTRCSP